MSATSAIALNVGGAELVSTNCSRLLNGHGLHVAESDSFKSLTANAYSDSVNEIQWELS